MSQTNKSRTPVHQEESQSKKVGATLLSGTFNCNQKSYPYIQSHRIYRTETFGQHSAPIRGLGSDVIVISANMALEDQIDISDEARRLIQPDQSSRVEERRLTGDLKRYLDTKYGRMWHVVVLNGSYWMNYSHEPQYSFQFRIGRYVILCWRTPAY
ncbi:unnamed protein product [Protopolystoma xenopodis]|uniref:Dynein light chain n=1 Tax=Protopolystoma xenopodis TaxID=117903 RepID=A0A448WJ46_9PLAT|nr:unnamed protein product [Protopolystoma xenopodis]